MRENGMKSGDPVVSSIDAGAVPACCEMGTKTLTTPGSEVELGIAGMIGGAMSRTVEPQPLMQRTVSFGATPTVSSTTPVCTDTLRPRVWGTSE